MMCDKKKKTIKMIFGVSNNIQQRRSINKDKDHFHQ